MEPKRFQKKTIDQVVRHLAKEKARFLVADEVGLGKTIVAKGVIEALYAKAEAKKIFRVIYLCSSNDIGKQNQAKLVQGVADSTGDSEAKEFKLSRLTLLARDLKAREGEETKKSLQLVCLTPKTSLQLGNNTGQKLERKIIHVLIAKMSPKFKIQGPKARRLAEFLIPSAGDTSQVWLNSVDGIAKAETKHIEAVEGLWDLIEKKWMNSGNSQVLSFNKELRKHFDNQTSLVGCVEVVAGKLYGKLKTDSKKVHELKLCRSFLIGQLRSELALATLEKFEADLVILDEFQNFSSILVSGEAAGGGESDLSKAERERKKFENRIALSLWKRKSRILLLSATPYKAASSDFSSVDESHYNHFWTVASFLLQGAKNRKDASQFILDLKPHFDGHREALGQMSADKSGDWYKKAKEHKTEIEAALRPIMVRSERFRHFDPVQMGVFDDLGDPWIDSFQSGRKIIAKTGKKLAPIDPRGEDALYLKWLLDAAPEGYAHMVPDFWASVPFALNLMRPSYKLIEKSLGSSDNAPTAEIKKAILLEELRIKKKIKAAEEDFPRLLIKRKELNELSLDLVSPSPKLRALLHDHKTEAFGEHLWIPPTAQYYSSKRIQANPKKRLVFSSWQAVPHAVSILATAEAEGRLKRKLRGAGTDLDSPALSLELPTKANPNKDRGTLALFHPSVWLADLVDPLQEGLKHSDYEQLKDAVAKKIEGQFKKNTIIKVEKKGTRGDSINVFRAIWRMEPEWYKAQFKEALDEVEEKLRKDLFIAGGGKIELTQEEIYALADICIGGPGVVLLRTLGRSKDGFVFEKEIAKDPKHLAALIDLCFGNIRRYFNTPPVGLAIRASYVGVKMPAWQLVAQYCSEHHLQAVLDEYGFLASDSVMGAGKSGKFFSMLKQLGECFQVPAGEPILREFDNGKIKSMPARRHIAQAFSDEKAPPASEDGTGELLRDHIRKLFNTPFWPFTLVTTSIGQEGLDFHRYCDEVVHWNLPHSPIAFEQREGRVQRYLGKNIRSALADDFLWRDIIPDSKRSFKKSNPWAYLLELAEAATKKNNFGGLCPFWIYKSKNGVARIRRRILCHPFSKEAIQYRRMKESVLIYRLTLGQARQEDMVKAIQRRLQQSEVGPTESELVLLNELCIDLSPKG